MEEEKIAMEVLRNIAMDAGRMLAERQRAIDALTLFRESSMETLEYIAHKTDLEVLRDRSKLYLQRIKSGAVLSMSV